MSAQLNLWLQLIWFKCVNSTDCNWMEPALDDKVSLTPPPPLYVLICIITVLWPFCVLLQWCYTSGTQCWGLGLDVVSDKQYWDGWRFWSLLQILRFSLALNVEWHYVALVPRECLVQCSCCASSKTLIYPKCSSKRLYLILFILRQTTASPLQNKKLLKRMMLLQRQKKLANFFPAKKVYRMSFPFWWQQHV